MVASDHMLDKTRWKKLGIFLRHKKPFIILLKMCLKHCSSFHPPNLFYWTFEIVSVWMCVDKYSSRRRINLHGSYQISVRDCYVWWGLNLYFSLTEQTLLCDISVSCFDTLCYSKQNLKSEAISWFKVKILVSVISKEQTHYKNINLVLMYGYY